MNYDSFISAIQDDYNDASFRLNGKDVHIEPIVKNSNTKYLLIIDGTENLYSSLDALMSDARFNGHSIKDYYSSLSINLY